MILTKSRKQKTINKYTNSKHGQVKHKIKKGWTMKGGSGVRSGKVPSMNSWKQSGFKSKPNSGLQSYFYY
jgi:hypothetical protein